MTPLVPKLGTRGIVPIIGPMIKSIRSDDGARLVAWLQEQRESQNLTMRQLAIELGVPHSFIGKVEQRERRLDVVEFVSYCEALNVSPVEGLKAVWPEFK
ncbi:helix-turn-helix domain-containing protein [Marinimicrobium sp. LS-A18]|uniref:helix-turn-helix domain-containing protein n=1 Tax=Marinimicrobium sp. LS-A18 TaxID=1381596 RepID=UPI001EE6B677|nr:helix-turn-helix transcriptional regulator [Marinimicrobium sp. LS-A18]